MLPLLYNHSYTDAGGRGREGGCDLLKADNVLELVDIQSVGDTAKYLDENTEFEYRISDPQLLGPLPLIF